MGVRERGVSERIPGTLTLTTGDGEAGDAGRGTCWRDGKGAWLISSGVAILSLRCL